MPLHTPYTMHRHCHMCAPHAANPPLQQNAGTLVDHLLHLPPALLPTPASPLTASCCDQHGTVLLPTLPCKCAANARSPKSPTPTPHCPGQSLERCCQTPAQRPLQQQPLPPLRQQVPWHVDGWHCCCGWCRCCQHSRQAPAGQHAHQGRPVGDTAHVKAACPTMEAVSSTGR